jgi:alanine racemase
MDLAMLDVTDIPEAQVGDVATIFGVSPECNCPPIYASDVARMLGTVTSDLLCSVGRRVPRFYLK